MIAEATSWLKEITPGGVGIYGMWATFLAIWWKGLPAIIDAIANRQSKIEERMGALLDKATERFQREIEAADKRHEDCIAGQDRLTKRVTELEDKVAEQAECIEEQQRTIEGLRRKALQGQVSALRVEEAPLSPAMERAMRALDNLPGLKE